MGEEGYDIARDMGKVRPSKDKKDATTMPVSKEMRKTQKVNKGPSALELVKKKYGKAVMNVGKKKANEELDLTQVAEAFGGYIIEANGKKNGKKKDDSIDDFIKSDDPFNVKAKEQAKKDIEKEPETMDIHTFQGRQKFKEPVSGTTQAKGFKPKPGSVKFTKKPGERPVKSYIDPSVIDPKFAKKQPSKSKTEIEDERKASRSFKKDLGKEKIVSPTMQDELEKITAKPQPRKSRTYKASSPERRDARIAAVKAAIDKRNPTYTSPVTGGQLPVGGADDYQKRLEKAYFGDKGELPNPFALPAGSKKQTGVTQTPRPVSDPAATGVFSGKGVGRKDVVGTAKPVETGTRSSVTANPRASREAQTGRDEKTGEILSKAERVRRFKSSRGQEPKTSDLVTQKPATEVPQPSKPSKPSPNVSTSLDTKELGRKFSEFGTKTQTAQQSTLGALGGFAVKQAVPASAAAEAGLRFAQGDTKGGILSGLQAMGGGLGFTAGVINAIRSMNPPKPRTDTGAITQVDPKKLLKRSAIVGGAVELARRARRATKGKSITGIKGGKAGLRSTGSYTAR